MIRITRCKRYKGVSSVAQNDLNASLADPIGSAMHCPTTIRPACLSMTGQRPTRPRRALRFPPGQALPSDWIVRKVIQLLPLCVTGAVPPLEARLIPVSHHHDYTKCNSAPT